MLLLAVLVLGLFAGWIAQLVVPTHARISWAEALVVGLLGSLVGGLLASLLFGDGLRLRPSGIVGSVVGAILVQLVWRAVRPKPAPRRPQHQGRVTPKRR